MQYMIRGLPSAHPSLSLHLI